MKRLLSELDDASLQVENVREQAIILMNARGGASRELVEPKLTELNRNFEKVAQHIQSAQMQIGQDPSSYQCLDHAGIVEAAGPFSDWERLEKDVENMLKVVERHLDSSNDEEKMDEERAQVEDVLQRGEHLLHEPMEDSKKEKIRLHLLLLHTRYNKLKTIPTQQRKTVPLFPDITSSALPADYLVEINKILLTMDDIELSLNFPELTTTVYEDFCLQENALKVKVQVLAFRSMLTRKNGGILSPSLSLGVTFTFLPSLPPLRLPSTFLPYCFLKDRASLDSPG